MSTRTTRDQLNSLLNTIIEERECAKRLDINGMVAAMREKEQLIQILSHVEIIDDDDKPLASRIRHENRRNAFLFKSTLGWIRETMEFFGYHAATSTYSSGAGMVSSTTNGRLLSGRI